MPWLFANVAWHLRQIWHCSWEHNPVYASPGTDRPFVFRDTGSHEYLADCLSAGRSYVFRKWSERRWTRTKSQRIRIPRIKLDFYPLRGYSLRLTCPYVFLARFIGRTAPDMGFPESNILSFSSMARARQSTRVSRLSARLIRSWERKLLSMDL